MVFTVPSLKFDRFGGQNINYAYNMQLKAKQLQLMLKAISQKHFDVKLMTALPTGK